MTGRYITAIIVIWTYLRSVNRTKPGLLFPSNALYVSFGVVCWWYSCSQRGDDVPLLLKHPSYSPAFHLIIDDEEGLKDKGKRRSTVECVVILRILLF